MAAPNLNATCICGDSWAVHAVYSDGRRRCTRCYPQCEGWAPDPQREVIEITRYEWDMLQARVHSLEEAAG